MTTNIVSHEPAFAQPPHSKPATRTAAGDLRQLLPTLIWEQMWLGKWPKLVGFAVSLLFMLIYLAITPILPGGWQQADQVRLGLEVSLLPAVIFILLLATGAGHWPASRLYAKPLSSEFIAGWQTWSGVVLLSIEMPLVTSCYNYFFDAGWPTGSSTLLTVALWVVAQPFFLVGTRSFGRLITTSLPITLMCIWYMSSYGLLLGERQEWLGLSSVEALAMLGIIIVFPSITKRVIVSDRCGESTGTNQLPKLFDSNSWIGTQTTTAIPPFRTPFAAHFWYQWRWKGFGLLYSMLWLSVIGGLAIALNHRGRGVWSDILTELLALTSVGFVFICGIYGFVLGANVDLWMVDRSRRERAQPRRSDAIGSFIGSQPISDQSLARVLLAVCTGAVAMAVVPWLLLCITTRWYSNDDIEVNHFWYSLLVLVALWWMAASNVMTVVCTGRSLTRWTLLVVGVLVVLAMAYRGPIENLLWIIFALTVLLLSACAVASFRKRFIGVKTLAAISGFLIAQIPINGWFATGQPDGWIWVTSIAALWCVMPIVAMPLAIEMNRHR